MENYLKTSCLILLLLISIVAGCSSTKVQNVSVEEIHIPENSIGSARAALAKDMVYSVDRFIQRNLACSFWSLNEVMDSRAVGQLVFTQEGQLYHGEMSEKWSLQQCGKPLSLNLIITVNPQGGSFIRIVAL